MSGWEEPDWRHANGHVADYYVVVETYAYSSQPIAMFLTEADATAWVAMDDKREERGESSDHLCVVLAREGESGKLMIWNSYEPAPEGLAPKED